MYMYTYIYIYIYASSSSYYYYYYYAGGCRRGEPAGRAHCRDHCRGHLSVSTAQWHRTAARHGKTRQDAAARSWESVAPGSRTRRKPRRTCGRRPAKADHAQPAGDLCVAGWCGHARPRAAAIFARRVGILALGVRIGVPHATLQYADVFFTRRKYVGSSKHSSGNRRVIERFRSHSLPHGEGLVTDLWD